MVVRKNNKFRETEDGRYLIEFKGIIRFQNVKEIKSEKYRILEVDYSKFDKDLIKEKESLKFSDLELIFKDLKSLFKVLSSIEITRKTKFR